MRSPASTAELALLVEVSATPTPGNVDRERDLDGLRFEQFLAGATGARPGLDLAAEGQRTGAAFERAVDGMAGSAGTNTQFGALLLLTPLVRAAAEDDCTPEAATAVAEGTTVADAADFYRAFDHVDVRVDDPPEGMEPLDVRRGSDAVPTVEDRDLTLYDVLESSADRDGIAREWVGGFERTFHAANLLTDEPADRPLSERAARVHLQLLAEEPDSLIATKFDDETAEEVRRRAAEINPADPTAVDALDSHLVEHGLNPGTTADLLAGGLFVALQREEVDV